MTARKAGPDTSRPTVPPSSAWASSPSSSAWASRWSSSSPSSSRATRRARRPPSASRTPSAGFASRMSKAAACASQSSAKSRDDGAGARRGDQHGPADKYVTAGRCNGPIALGEDWRARWLDDEEDDERLSYFQKGHIAHNTFCLAVLEYTFFFYVRLSSGLSYGGLYMALRFLSYAYASVCIYVAICSPCMEARFRARLRRLPTASCELVGAFYTSMPRR